MPEIICPGCGRDYPVRLVECPDCRFANDTLPDEPPEDRRAVRRPGNA